MVDPSALSSLSSSSSSAFPPPPLPSSSSSSSRTASGNVDSKLSFFYQNVRGLRSKLSKTRSLLPTEDFDVFAFTESNLTDSHFNSEIGFHNFSVFRCDRILENTTNRRNKRKKSGGGVLLAVSDRFPSSLICHSSCGYEQLFVRVATRDQNLKSLVIGLVYIPPTSPPLFFSSHFEEVERLRGLYPDDTFVLLGDYNLPELSWTDFDNVPLSSTPRSCVFLDFISYHDLYQFNFIHNNLDRVLDLVLSSVTCSVEPTSSFLPIDPSHPPLLIQFPLNSIVESVVEQFSGYNFRKAPYLILNNIFSSFDWDSYLNSLDVEENVKLFNDFLNNIFQVFVPPIWLKRDSFPVWYTSHLKSLIISKKHFHKLYKSTGHPHFYHQFSNLRAQCKDVASQCYSSYLNSVVRNIKADPRYFWKYNKNLRGGSSLPKVLRYNGIESSSPLSSADLFASYFSSSFADVSICSPNFEFDFSDPISSCSISLSDVRRKLSLLSIHKGGGPDGIPPIFLKNCSSSLAYPLFHLFNQSLYCGVFPTSWKSCFVSPIPKKDSGRNEVNNYRPVSILSSIPKLFESLVLDKLLPFFTPLIISNQHGFLPRKSVSTNLLQYLNYISSNLPGTQVDSVYLDLTKAFDRVNHRILLDKLSSFGISGSLHHWFSSYLSNRTSMVRVGSSFSKSFVSTSGVPQGSHLGPILFLLFINNVQTCLDSHDVQYLLFADDLKIFRCINSDNDFQILQDALLSLKQWFDVNLLEVNPLKCNVITFSRSSSPLTYSYSLDSVTIPRSQCVRDLGVLFDSKLSFNPHIDAICNKASKMLGFVVRSTRDFPDTLSFKILYCSLVRNTLEFASCIWNPVYSYNCARIEQIQHRALKTLGWKSHSSDLSDFSLQKTFNLLPLSVRREMFDMITLFNILQNNIDSPDLLSSINVNVPGYVTSRQTLPFRPPFVRTNYLQNSPLIRFQRSANMARDHLDLFSTTLTSIRNHYSRYLQ